LSFVVRHMCVLTSKLSRCLVSIDQVKKLTRLGFIARLEASKEADLERGQPRQKR
jgi:hypothetical protein